MNEKREIIKRERKIYMYEQLITDDIFLKILSEQKQKGIFDIVGQTHTEHWHSAFICWLLAPDSNHGLCNYPINRLLSLYQKKLKDVENKECEELTLSNILDFESDSLAFRTERSISGEAQGQIDILGTNKDYVIVIENKVDADERVVTVDGKKKGQTNIYYDYFSNKRNYDNVKKIYIFLTAEDKKPWDNHFMKITYQEFYDNVITKCLINPDINPEAKYLIEQYVCNLRKKSNKTKKALALPAKSDCKFLFEKYSDLFERIFEATKKDAGNSSEEFKLYKKYQSVFDEIFLSVKGICPTVNLQGEDFVKYLIMTKRIHVGDEFFHKGTECTFEADLLEDNGKYYFVVGVKDEWAILDGKNSDGMAHYTHFKAAAQAIQDEWNTRKGKKGNKASIDGTSWWHLGSVDGPTPKDLQ